MDRRTFLRTVAGAAVATPLLPLGLPASGAAAADPGVFRHGVASGDPAPDGVVLWTRVTEGTGRPVDVDWVLAEDEGLTRPVRSGRATATADADHTVHVAVTGLAPATTYWYGFRAGEESSPVGRTRTAPDGAVERVRFGVCCCARFSDGYFNAYAGLAAAEVARRHDFRRADQRPGAGPVGEHLRARLRHPRRHGAAPGRRVVARRPCQPAEPHLAARQRVRA